MNRSAETSVNAIPADTPTVGRAVKTPAKRAGSVCVRFSSRPPSTTIRMRQNENKEHYICQNNYRPTQPLDTRSNRNGFVGGVGTAIRHAETSVVS